MNCRRCTEPFIHGAHARIITTPDGLRAICEHCYSQSDKEPSFDPWFGPLHIFSKECGDKPRVMSRELRALLDAADTKENADRIGRIMRALKFRPMSVRDHNGRVMAGWGRDSALIEKNPAE